jgi:hypothetical protein
VAEVITATAALVAAVGAVAAVVVGYLNRRAMTAAKEKAVHAANAAAEAKAAAQVTSSRLVIVEDKIVEVGKQIDGRLSELLASETGRARAEGIAQGEQTQRDRASGPQY